MVSLSSLRRGAFVELGWLGGAVWMQMGSGRTTTRARICRRSSGGRSRSRKGCGEVRESEESDGDGWLAWLWPAGAVVGTMLRRCEGGVFRPLGCEAAIGSEDNIQQNVVSTSSFVKIRRGFGEGGGVTRRPWMLTLRLTPHARETHTGNGQPMR